MTTTPGDSSAAATYEGFNAMPPTEAELEVSVLEQLAEFHDWVPKDGRHIVPGSGERQSWDELAIRPRFERALRALNPTVPAMQIVNAVAEILRPTSEDAITENERLHRFITEGYRGASWIDTDGVQQNPTLRLVSVDPDENDWLAVNQVTVRQREVECRFDVVLYCNGLPVAIVELKRAGSAAADLASAHRQLQSYVRDLPTAFRATVLTVISDGVTAKYGTPFTPLHHFSPWNVDDDGRPLDVPDVDAGESFALPPETALETLIDGLFNQTRFLQLLRNFVAFDEGTQLAKRIAKPHQYFAVTKAVAATIHAVQTDGKAGVVWHTQGSGKSMEMELYTHAVQTHPQLRNPTVVVVTDRNELDGQLFDAFSASKLLPDRPTPIASRAQLRHELSERTTGGVYFTTLQKFGLTDQERAAGESHPLLTDRSNVIVIVDEAHRSHYDDLDGYARHLRDALPRATLIAFTGTPISAKERNTRQVFGDYIDIYDLTRAVNDGATVPVVFEPRLIKVSLADGVSPEDLDATADRLAEGLDDAEREKIERSVAVINAVYGAPARLATLADDLIAHWETRRQAMASSLDGPGKAMVVCGTRDICARLYEALVERRPDWHSEDLNRGVVKVVYSGDRTDPDPISRHVRRESQNKAVKSRLKRPDDELQLVIVKDMMLTGFDAPPLHTLYLDRPLNGALLMQTLARVNRTFRGKSAGLLVAYAPLADNLRAALSEYTATDQATRPLGKDFGEEVEVARALLGQLDVLTEPFGWRRQYHDRTSRGDARAYQHVVHALVNWLRDPRTPGNEIPPGADAAHAEGATLRSRFRALANGLGRAWALCAASGKLDDVRPAVKFYEEARVWMAKLDAANRASLGLPVPEDVARLLSQAIAEVTEAGDVLDIYAAAGMPKPRLDQLGPEFVAQAQQAANPHLAIEALRDLIASEAIKATGGNVIRQQAFSERLSELMRKYTNQQLTSAEVIAELVELAKDVHAERTRGDSFTPPLNIDELTFLDAVALNESAVTELGAGKLADIARDIVAVMRRDIRTDWTVRDDVRAKLRTTLKRVLRKHGYPPDRQPEAVKRVMDQMEAMAPRIAAETH